MGVSAAMRSRSLRGALAIALLLGGAACGERAPRAVSRAWWVGGVLPAFDPAGPQDAVRWSLERLLTRGLVEEDRSGRVVPVAAERVEFAPDGLTCTFHLRRDLRFTNGARCGSADFRAALERGLARTDHATMAWALAAVRGVEAVRSGRPLPPLGIRTPDESTLVLELARRDTLLLRRLSIPGLCTPWAAYDSAAGWKGAVGLGPYRVREAESRHVVLVRTRAGRAAQGAAWPDTLNVRFEAGAARLRAALRAGRVDLLWPVPGALRAEPQTGSYRHTTAPSVPGRRLLLMIRADVPPASKLPARRALAHGLDRSDVVRLLGAGARDPVSWWPGTSPFEFPKLDAQEVEAWLERGRLGRSFHVLMLLDADGTGTAVARSLQGEWARLNLSVDLLPLRGGAQAAEALRGWRAHLVLADWQPLLDDPAAELAALVLPARGPAVGPIRSGWRTRELDPWIVPGRVSAPIDLEGVQRRLAEQLVALPLADLDWTWIERSGGPGFEAHPHFGPEVAPGVTPASPAP
jgi:ABC-type transport system substrate-binding protein